jgi:cytochrome c oxidase subunit 2
MSIAPASSTPMSYLHTVGPAADPVTRLGWGLGIISVAVIVIIAALLLAAVLRRQGTPGEVAEVSREGEGLRWIYIGVGISSVVLAACAIWTLLVLTDVAHPATKPAFTVRVTGLQWWWRVRYENGDASQVFTTANEVHVPVGQPVRLELESGDVIHSFWVPQLGGKTDTIPGQTNVSWFQADKPGVYRGQCAEYCGEQHAHMALQVVAEPPAAFQAWWRAQLAAAAPAPAAGPAAAGAALVQERCAACHTVRGTDAGGLVGPDLTHLASRGTIAGGTLPNDAQHLADWIAHAQRIKPGTKMPEFALSAGDLSNVVAYLSTLR